MDTAALKQQLNRFCRRVVGTREAYECLVPEREGRSGTTYGKVVFRQDRIRTHILSEHVGKIVPVPTPGKDGWCARPRTLALEH